MRSYTPDCFCGTRGPRYISSELAERWLLEHVSAEHPGRLDLLRERILNGTLKPLMVGPGGELIPVS